jgi:hypothetical protein
MNIFRVVGPCKVHRSTESGGRMITEQGVRRFVGITGSIRTSEDVTSS